MQKLLEKFKNFTIFIESAVDNIIIKYALQQVINDEEILKKKFQKFMELLKPNLIEWDVNYYMQLYGIKQQYKEKIKNY